ncbi:MAG TPA: hypothetical protein VMS17_25870 [Gemmataceae bacterium]|nr:hypothetical protein [Gemmataceae bacterium]
MARIKWAMLAMTAITLGMGATSTAKAGAISGSKITADVVEAFHVDTYTVRFEAGEPALVVLKGDGDTNLELEVYDENGHLIAANLDDGAGALVTWTPKWTGKFTIKVVNRGAVFNHYRLATN